MTKFLDLDAIAEALVMTVKLGGKEHRMKTPSVKDLATVVKDMEQLSLNASMSTELEAVMSVIERFYPTLKRDDIEALTAEQIWQLFNFTLNAITGVLEKEDAQGNAPEASSQAST